MDYKGNCMLRQNKLTTKRNFERDNEKEFWRREQSFARSRGFRKVRILQRRNRHQR